MPPPSLSKPHTLTVPDAVARPKLPAYQDREDITNYLTHSERVAELLQLNQSTHAVRLGCLLIGKAAELYVSLSPEITSNYATLKLSGFKRYCLDFHIAKIRDGENYMQFAIHLTHLFQRWLNASKVQENFNFLKTLYYWTSSWPSWILTSALLLKSTNPHLLTAQSSLWMFGQWHSTLVDLPPSPLHNLLSLHHKLHHQLILIHTNYFLHC